MTAETGRGSTPRPLAALAGLGRMASANLIGRVTSTPDGVRDANDAFLRLAGYTLRGSGERPGPLADAHPIERRGEPINAGFGRLARAAGRGLDLDIAAWCQNLLSALTQGETLADDVALACIELRGLP